MQYAGMIKDLASENVNLEKWKFMYIGKLPNISYCMKISTSPGSFMELSEVNFEKDLHGYMELLP